MIEKIMFQKVKIRDLDVGDDVFDEDLKIGLVLKKGKTMLHQHPSISINFHWCNSLNNERDETTTYFAEELEQEIYRIYWIKKQKKPSRYLKKKRKQ